MRHLLNRFLRAFGLRPAAAPAPAGDWDDRAAVLAEFPESEWERVPTTGEDDARLLVAFRAMCKGEFVRGEARWFGPGDGVLFFPRRPQS